MPREATLPPFPSKLVPGEVGTWEGAGTIPGSCADPIPPEFCFQRGIPSPSPHLIFEASESMIEKSSSGVLRPGYSLYKVKYGKWASGDGAWVKKKGILRDLPCVKNRAVSSQGVGTWLWERVRERKSHTRKSPPWLRGSSQ